MQTIQTERGGEGIDKLTDRLRLAKGKDFSPETKAAAAAATCVSLRRGSKHSRHSPARLATGIWGGRVRVGGSSEMPQFHVRQKRGRK